MNPSRMKSAVIAAALGALAALAARPAAAADCNENGVDDAIDISTGTSRDCDGNGVPDECDPFVLTTSLVSPTTALAVTAADLDGDGHPDLATAHGDVCANDGCLGSDGVAVLLNLGDGSYAPAVDYPGGDGPTSIAAADLDGDGRLDLIAANQFDRTISTYRNKGLGTFSPRVSYVAGDDPMWVCAADFDGDGKPDVAVAASAMTAGAPAIAVLRNNGNGTLGAAVRFPVGPMPGFVTTADVDGDGHLDLLVGFCGSSIAVLRNKGNGTIAFLAPAEIPVGGCAYSIAPADLDGDGDLDLAVADWGLFGGSRGISVLRNSGGGAFAVSTTIDDGVATTSVAAADFDGDGVPDLAAASFDSGKMSFFRGRGDGGFDEPFRYATGSWPLVLAAADFDGNGRADVAVARQSGDDRNVVLLSNLPLAARADVNGNGIWDRCDPDCNRNGVPDDWDIHTGTSNDLDSNAIPDECQQPMPPKDLVATPGEGLWVNFTWTPPENSLGIKRYVVYRDGQEIGGTSWPDVFTYGTANPAYDIQYCYTVRSTTELVQSVDSDPACVTSVFVPPPQVPFRRGDVDGSGRVDIGDVLALWGYLYIGISIPCRSAADVDVDGAAWFLDTLLLSSWLFMGGHSSIPSPGPFFCGIEPFGDQDCRSYDCSATGVAPATDEFELGFDLGPRVCLGGSAVTVLSTLTHSGAGSGALAYSFGVVAEGGKILSIGTEGLDVHPFELASSVTTGDGNEGAISAAKFIRLNPHEALPLPTNAASTVAVLTVEPLPGSLSVTLRYSEDLRPSTTGDNPPVLGLVSRFTAGNVETLSPRTVPLSFPSPDSPDFPGAECCPVWSQGPNPSWGNCWTRGDVDGDGRTDIAIGTPPSSVIVSLAAPDGTYSSATYQVPQSIDTMSSIAIADVGGDGLADIAVVTDSGGQSTVRVLPGKPGGGFKSVVSYPAGAAARTVLADADGDGLLDVIKMTQSAGSAKVSLLLGKAGGGLKAETSYKLVTAPGAPSSVALGDVDLDGRIDLVAAVKTSTEGVIAVLHGKDSGGYGTPQVLSLGSIGPDSLQVSLADIDLDGRPDIAVALERGDGSPYYLPQVAVLLGEPGGDFAEHVDHDVAGNLVLGSIAVADFDGDGRPDVAVSDVTPSNKKETPRTHIFIGQPDGTLLAHEPSLPGCTLTGACDLNADGWPDLVSVSDRSDSQSLILLNGMCGRGRICPDAGDTHCLGLAVTGPAGGGPGKYVASARARDDSGDSVLYTFAAQRSGEAPILIGPQSGSAATFDLGAGAWTVGVTVDDHPECPAAAADASCSASLVLCPSAGDTHCLGLLVSCPDGNVAGAYTATANAKDDSGDPVLYTFTAQRGDEAPIVVGPQAGNAASFDLSVGTWTISVDVDDEPSCPDIAADARCSASVEVRQPGGLVLPGDANGDAALDLSDPVTVLEILFLGSAKRFPCGDGSPKDPGNLVLLDWQPDGTIDISDAVSMLSFLFVGGDPHALAVPGAETKSCVRIAGCTDRCRQ